MLSNTTADEYLLIITISGILNIALLCIVLYKQQVLKNSLQRRNSKENPEEQQLESFCSKKCKDYCRFEKEVIPELKNDIETYKSLYMEQQRINAILESTNAKLRIRKTEENNND